MHSLSQTNAIYCYHAPFSLLAWHPNPLNIPSAYQSYHSIFSPHGWTFGENLHQTKPFVTLYNSLIYTFGSLSILLIPSKPLRLFIYRALTLDLSSFHIIISLLYIRTGRRNVSCKISKENILSKKIIKKMYIQFKNIGIFQNRPTVWSMLVIRDNQIIHGSWVGDPYPASFFFVLFLFSGLFFIPYMHISCLGWAEIFQPLYLDPFSFLLTCLCFPGFDVCLPCSDGIYVIVKYFILLWFTLHLRPNGWYLVHILEGVICNL